MNRHPLQITISLLLCLGVAFVFSPAVAEMQPLDSNTMSSITGAGGLGVQIDLRLNVSESWQNANDNSEGNGEFTVEDDDGLGSGSSGWLYLQHIYGTISPESSGDNILHIDAGPDYVQFSQGGAFTGINLSIGDIAVQDSSFSCCDDELASITIGNNDADSDNDYVDGQGSIDFHNTKLQLF